MNPRLPKSVLLPLAAGLAQFLSGCMTSTVNDPNANQHAGGSDEIDTRIAVDRTGKPVAAARIALVRPKDSTGKLVAVSATGKDGSFPNFVVPDGFYSMVLRDSGESMGKYVDSVVVKNQKLPSGRDTLLALGSVRGVVRVSVGHSPATVSVGLVGTDILATVKSDGTFRIELVPGGVYTLGAFPTLEGYGPLYKRIQLKDGQNLTLPDTLVMPFTGLASPGALRVLQDTGTGNVRLSWSPVDHPDLLGYVVDRVEGGAVTTSRYLTDTSWTDSLGAYWASQPLLGPWPSRNVAYRVRSRSLSGTPDSKSIAQTFTAKPPMWTSRVDSTQPVLSQDTSTGDVRIHWSPVRHPHLKGYVVERLENGIAVSQRIQPDTNLVDSIGVYWNALPLLGPWPQRSLSYRIRLVADSVATNTVTASTDFVAKPPEWTKRVDSVKVMWETDPANGVATLRWTPLVHPDLIGWKISRETNGIEDCGETTKDSFWRDSKCADPRRTPLDSMVDQNGVVISLLDGREIRRTYSVLAQRKLGNSISFSGGNRELAKSMVEWRDSVPAKVITSIVSKGGWVFINAQSISRDGISWEDSPEDYTIARDKGVGYRWDWSAQGDSVWFGELTADSLHLSIFSRISKGNWKQFTMELPGKWSRLSCFTAIGNRLVVSGINLTNDESVWLIDSNRMQSMSFGDGWKYSTWVGQGMIAPLANGWRFDLLMHGTQSKEASAYLISPDSTVYFRHLFREQGLDGTYTPIGNNGGFVCCSGMERTFDYYDIRSDYGYRLDMPKSDKYNSGGVLGVIASMNGEIWTMTDGHLWKGKLNLPK